jgi:hypothetical protein
MSMPSLNWVKKDKQEDFLMRDLSQGNLHSCKLRAGLSCYNVADFTEGEPIDVVVKDWIADEADED